MKAIQSTLPALALLALPVSATAATVVTNNTGLDASTFRFIDLETTAGAVIVTTPGDTATITGSLGGADGDQFAFGNAAPYGANAAGANSVLYTFNSLTAGTYNVYGTWAGGGGTGATVTVGGSSGATGSYSFAQGPGQGSIVGSTGFTAYQTNDLPAEANNFQLLGTVTAATNGTLTIDIRGNTQSFFRADAFAIAPVPEPSAAILGGLGLLGLLRRRRA